MPTSAFAAPMPVSESKRMLTNLAVRGPVELTDRYELELPAGQADLHAGIG